MRPGRQPDPQDKTANKEADCEDEEIRHHSLFTASSALKALITLASPTSSAVARQAASTSAIARVDRSRSFSVSIVAPAVSTWWTASVRMIAHSALASAARFATSKRSDGL